MTLQQLDELLKLWKGRLSALAEGLLELQADSTNLGLTATATTGEALTGLTAERAREITPRIHRLFQQFSLLTEVTEAAEKLRSGLPAFFGGEARLKEAAGLLLGPSIRFQQDSPAQFADLGAGIAGIPTVSSGADSCTPDQLLTAMSSALEEVRGRLAEISQASASLRDRSAELERELLRARAQTALPSALLEQSIVELETELGHRQQEQLADPLGALARLRQEVEPRLASLAQRISRAEQVGRQLAVARCQWQTLLQVHGQAKQALADAALRFCSPLPVTAELTPEPKLAGLGAWLERLESRQESGASEAVAVGLRNWTCALDACLGADRRLIAAAQEQSAHQAELRGRFDALRAKARTLQGAEELGDMGRHAQELLRASPMDLPAAQVALACFEQDLRAAAGHRADAVPAR